LTQQRMKKKLMDAFHNHLLHPAALCVHPSEDFTVWKCHPLENTLYYDEGHDGSTRWTCFLEPRLILLMWMKMIVVTANAFWSVRTQPESALHRPPSKKAISKPCAVRSPTPPPTGTRQSQ
jgi:hypothetical protein